MRPDKLDPGLGDLFLGLEPAPGGHHCWLCWVQPLCCHISLAHHDPGNLPVRPGDVKEDAQPLIGRVDGPGEASDVATSHLEHLEHLGLMRCGGELGADREDSVWSPGGVGAWLAPPVKVHAALNQKIGALQDDYGYDIGNVALDNV